MRVHVSGNGILNFWNVSLQLILPFKFSLSVFHELVLTDYRK